jgi:organic radical activating enzyme
MISSKLERFWHVTVLSNFARAYNKYGRSYSKSAIPESTYPDRFFLLRPEELSIGVHKAQGLLKKLALPGNRLIALRTQVDRAEIKPNLRSGLGQFVERADIHVEQVCFIEEDESKIHLQEASIEEAIALSFQLLNPQLHSYDTIVPRSFSYLPIARGCQASCPFCFSEASASAEQEQARIDFERLRCLAGIAQQRGAKRFVITGGGEPGLVRHELLQKIIALGHEVIGKSVLITNGHHLARLSPDRMAAHLADYANAGLSVLAISRHHHDPEVSSRLMSLETNVPSIVNSWKEDRLRWPDLRLRLTCVLQRNGVDSLSAMESYVDWASTLGVSEICFKELYVSTSVESVYHRHAANQWSLANQVPLALVLLFVELHGFQEVERLPWGSPVFAGQWKGHPIQIAAYTEPSLLWERVQGIARSWNLMSDGRCLASLEDRASEVPLPVAA